MEASLPIDEALRLETLNRYRILDTPDEKDFDDIVRLAAAICETPVSLVSLVDRDRQWFKGRYGFAANQTPRKVSFCAHSILTPDEPLVVPDAALDPRFADNDLVTGEPGVRFYAGCPLVTPDNYALGTLCVIDRRPRSLSPSQLEALRILSRQVMTQMELRLRMSELQHASMLLIDRHTTERNQQQALVKERTSELNHVNSELRRSEERLRTLAEATFEGIFITRGGKIVDCNSAAAAMLGWGQEELRGQSIFDFLPETERELARAGGWEGRGTILQAHLRPRNAEERIAEVRSRHLATDRELRVIAMRDVTEQRRTEQALAASESRRREELERVVAERTAQLREANENLQNFTHTAAHDMRSLLRGIISFSEIAREEYGPKIDANGNMLLQRVSSSANQMALLLADLLEYSKMSQAELRLEKTELNLIVKQVVALLDDELKLRDAVVHVVEPMPAVKGHPATAVVLVSNLVSNAVKFVARDKQPRIRISTAERGEFVRLTVEDNGIGISPEDLTKLFSIFQRIHSKYEYPGTGLGLAIVRKGIERMGGHVGVDSEPGKGSRFWLEFQKFVPA